MELYVLINKKRGMGEYILDSLLLVLTIAFIVISCAYPLFMIVAALLALGFYATHFLMNIEYEYAYFGGEIKIARISNKSRRKRLLAFTMDEVEKIAPRGHESVVRMENDKTYQVKDYTSHDKNVDFYEAFVNHDGNKYLVMFEPDEPFLDEIRTRYASKVVKKPQY